MAKARDADDGDYYYVFCRKFWHRWAKRFIYARPGHFFRLKFRRK